jgi:dienelactone hydrolase
LPAILVLGGSEGGIRGSRQGAIAFAREGYATLAVAYFGTGNLPPNLQNVPLEYFGSALDWMQHEPSIDQRRIAVHGVSKGGEAALLIASRFPIIKAVVAGVPSHVVWQGINFQSWAPKSSWSAAGKDVPFLPYDSTRPFISVLDLYVRSLEFENRFPDAAIPVERINGAVLLISAGDDKLWPSKAMSDRVMARLDANRFAHPHVHLSYADAGHGVASPPARNLAGKYPSNLGGSDAGNAAGRADMWANTLKFLAENLKR